LASELVFVSGSGRSSVFVDDAAQDAMSTDRGVERDDNSGIVVGWAVLASLVRAVIVDVPGELVKDRDGVAFVVDLVNMNVGIEGRLVRCLRCCTSRWRNLWTFGVALREEASNHLPGPWLKTVVLNGVGKGAAETVSGVDREDERWAVKPSADGSVENESDDIETRV